MFNNRFFTKIVLLASFFFSIGSLTAQTLPSGFSFTEMTGWNQPVGTAFNTSGSKMFVWEKGGRVYVCNWDGSNYIKQATAVLNISPEVGDWRDHGLLGFALDPNFDANGFIYVLYVVDRHYLINFGTGSYNAATNTYFAATIGRLTRYQTTMSGGNLVVVPASRTILLGETKSTGIPILYESHGVGSLAFAADGTLLVSAGEAASYDITDFGSGANTYFTQALSDGIIRANENVGAFRSQMLNSYSGKVLRLDPVTGNGLSSNPYYNPASPRSAQSRLWAFGLRNPFRMSIRPNTGSSNPATGDLGEIYVGDVGWGDNEELNIIKEPASNCGWPYYEGLSAELNYATLNNVQNKDEVNPLFGISGCVQQYFTFRNLLKQATADNIHTVYNPCNPAVAITSPNDNRFFHHLPAVDWKHNFDSTRVAVFPNNDYVVKQVGTAASGVAGTPLRGNASTGGCWYTGTLFPPQYSNSYFVSDYGGTWIRNIKIQFTDHVQQITDFATGFGGIVHLSQNPDGTLYATDIVAGSIKRITFGGNQPPVAKLSSNVKYGPGPLNVNFTGNTSFDPEGGSISYSWNFGDGSPVVTTANPSHSFSSGNSNPKKFVVKLTVKDSVNATSIDSLFISINNTPPNVDIISPIDNSLYALGSDTAYTLQATVTDAEHAPNKLSYVWQTILRHNSHEHAEPIDTVKLTDAVISRIGCNGDMYYWFVKLTVTDADGLSSVDSSRIFPSCGGPLPLTLNSFSVSSQNRVNLLRWITSDEINLRNFEIERSYDGVNFQKIGTENARTTAGIHSYEFRDDNFLDGYIYYRLRMVDNDNKFSYSFIVRVFSGTKTNNEITISPNPFKNDFLLGASFKEGGNVTIRIIDAKGAVVKVIKENVNPGFNSFTIDKLGNLGKGVYFLELIQGTETRKSKLIKD